MPATSVVKSYYVQLTFFCILRRRGVGLVLIFISEQTCIQSFGGVPLEVITMGSILIDASLSPSNSVILSSRGLYRILFPSVAVSISSYVI